MLITFDMCLLDLSDKLNLSLADPLGNEVTKQMVEILNASPYAGLDTSEIPSPLWARTIRSATKRAQSVQLVYDCPTLEVRGAPGGPL